MRGKLLSALVLAAVGVAVLSLQAGESQGAAPPENPGEALRSGRQIAHFAVGYASLVAVNRPDNYLKT